jgi:hypothetical protein
MDQSTLILLEHPLEMPIRGGEEQIFLRLKCNFVICIVRDFEWPVTYSFLI